MSAPKSDAPVSSPTVPDAANPASLDKVRDILFGNQMRDVERRFSRLEERLVKETADRKDEVRKRLDTLEAYVRGENESLEGQIKSERGDRSAWRCHEHDALTARARPQRRGP
ncbi:MAG: hypothetical protein ABL982_08755 [Vicinamibacterales bacterium]